MTITDEDRDLLIRIDERVNSIHDTLPTMQVEIDDNKSSIAQLKGAGKLLVVVLIPIVLAVIGAHLK